MNTKIFCIGLNKTGTSSLHEAFKILNIKSIHYRDKKGIDIKKSLIHNHLNNLPVLTGIDHYEAFSDWDEAPYTVEIFKKIDKQYPNTKFILNIRDKEDWLNSREKHVKRNQERKKKYPEKNITWLTIDRTAWEQQFDQHYGEAFQYFKDRPEDLLVFDVTKGDGWEKLCPFLNLPIPKRPFPKKNTASSKGSIFKRLFKKLTF